MGASLLALAKSSYINIIILSIDNFSSTYFLIYYCSQDEIHERDRFSDFLLIAMRDLLTVNRRLKLILMSAALDINLFIEYFGKCPVVHGNVSKYIAEFIIC